MGAIFQQKQEEEWETTNYASLFLTVIEQYTSLNELELLAVKGQQKFLGILFVDQNLRPCLIIGLQLPHSKKFDTTKLLRQHKRDGCDRLFQFEVVHEPGSTVSRHPFKNSGNEHNIRTEELWNTCITVIEKIRSDNLVSANQKAKPMRNQPKEAKLVSGD